ncbi:quinolinate synthase NadA [Desulfovibrio aminophilus]|uniref:quinolinate synthase NadA n=1 Tax=Desulfovibrio aminophilus TaxID=81425 RepID=UPI003397F57F
MNDTHSRIEALRAALGGRLAILGHHYQSDEVIAHVDFRGDSLELSRRVPQLSAEHIVFCGVFFMAESAAVLAREGQKVHIPAPEAGCTMSNMAPAPLLAAVLEALGRDGRRVTPLTYVNSSAEVKAVCGRFGGSVCTSANAKTMLAWALEQGETVLFLPDKNLAANTADALGLTQAERHVLNIRAAGSRLDLKVAATAKLLVWPGCCSIHHRFRARHVAEARATHPGCLVAVHPECPDETVRAADAVGSTSFLIDFTAKAPAGSTLVIGTEEALVLRLAKQYADEKIVLPLKSVRCANMAKTTPANLAALLENLDRLEPVRVAPEIAKSADLALRRMLDACARA